MEKIVLPGPRTRVSPAEALWRLRLHETVYASPAPRARAIDLAGFVSTAPVGASLPRVRRLAR